MLVNLAIHEHVLCRALHDQVVPDQRRGESDDRRLRPRRQVLQRDEPDAGVGLGQELLGAAEWRRRIRWKFGLLEVLGEESKRTAIGTTESWTPRASLYRKDDGKGPRMDRLEQPHGAHREETFPQGCVF